MHALKALPSAAAAQPSNEKRRAWEAEQLRIARLADVPRTEYYYCHHIRNHHDSMVQVNASHNEGAAPDEDFVHQRFALPDFGASLLARSKTGATDCSEVPDTDSTTCVSASVNSPWEALLCQIRFDRDQQSAAAVAQKLPALTLVGGVDISFVPNSDDGVACLAILRYPTMEHVQTYMHRCTLREPYISGFLAFREIQPVCELFDSVRAELLATQTMPQLLIVDGNGVQHPRRCGLATHLGVVLGIPTIGCAKKMLQMDGLTREAVEAALETLGEAASSSPSLPRLLPLLSTSSPRQLYGYAVQGHRNSVKKCIYVSPGHCIGFAVATALVITMLRHRIPEPVRAADLNSRAYINGALASATATSSHPTLAVPSDADARSADDGTPQHQ
ncbi:endonuclease V, putative [Leishmania tarentolae]|uniref:Endonuclease V, putative n=1 Tax=Leishmania tarentolae TaxID=5689 RepID=A0A640L0I2_LEITA|nr:endonuclease V, putative [Leishmania tarentolae]